jgi:hypothetical protein
MPELLIRIKKNKDGSASLACVRADGSTTWQRQDGQLGAFFPPHDLTHYAIETVLGYRNGFYGLIADGWEISDFNTPFPRGKLPWEAREVEALVGALDVDRMTGELRSSADVNEQVRFTLSRDKSASGAARQLTDAELACVREVRGGVLTRWSALEPGGTLELPFDRG